MVAQPQEQVPLQEAWVLPQGVAVALLALALRALALLALLALPALLVLLVLLVALAALALGPLQLAMAHQHTKRRGSLPHNWLEKLRTNCPASPRRWDSKCRTCCWGRWKMCSSWSLQLVVM